MIAMKTFLKYPENNAFIICRIVFRHGRRQDTCGLQNLGLAGAEELRITKIFDLNELTCCRNKSVGNNGIQNRSVPCHDRLKKMHCLMKS